MIIRKARLDDSGAIARFAFMAMEDIVGQFIGDNSQEKGLLFLESLIKDVGNQYSFENCWVVDSDSEVVAAAIVYDGARLHELKEPVIRRVETMFGRVISPEDETQAGEYYIDCVGVDPSQRGKGVGSRIFHFLIDEYVQKRSKTLGLLVDDDNPGAKKLYLKLGFEVVGNKTLMGKSMEHLQMRP